MANLISDPVSLLLDDDNDLVMPLEFATGLTAVAQGIRARIQSFKGEWFADLDDGVPWLERPGVTAVEALLGQKFNPVKARAMFRTAILSTPNVTGLIGDLRLNFDGATRTLFVSWQARTAFGDTDVDSLTLEA